MQQIAVNCHNQHRRCRQLQPKRLPGIPYGIYSIQPTHISKSCRVISPVRDSCERWIRQLNRCASTNAHLCTEDVTAKSTRGSHIYVLNVHDLRLDAVNMENVGYSNRAGFALGIAYGSGSLTAQTITPELNMIQYFPFNCKLHKIDLWFRRESGTHSTFGGVDEHSKIRICTSKHSH